MDLKSSHPYWPIKNGLVATYPPLENDEECDVLVLGGGITGAIFADRLTKEGFDVVVVDRRDIGHGSTSASTAMLQYEIDTHLIDLLDMIGPEQAERAYRLSVDSLATLAQLAAECPLDCGFTKKRSVYAASTEADVEPLRREALARRRIGIDAEFVEGPEVRERYALPHPAAIVSAEAATADPYLFAHGLLKQAVRRGARVYDRTEATKFDPAFLGRHEIETDRGPKIRADDIVFATGYESQQYTGEKVCRFKSTYALVTQPLASVAPWNEHHLFWESARPYLYFRTTDDRRLVAGGADLDFRSALKRDALIERQTAHVFNGIKELFPQLAPEIEYAWAGTFAETKDGLAYIGRPAALPHAYFALGFGGNGITYSTIAADIVADQLKGRPNTDAEIFRFGR